MTPTVLLVWIVCGLAAYWIADKRGFTNGVAWFVLGIALGPFGIVAAFLAPLPGTEPDPAAFEWFEYRGSSRDAVETEAEAAQKDLETRGYVFAYQEWTGSHDRPVLRVAYRVSGRGS